MSTCFYFLSQAYIFLTGLYNSSTCQQFFYMSQYIQNFSSILQESTYIYQYLHILCASLINKLQVPGYQINFLLTYFNEHICILLLLGWMIYNQTKFKPNQVKAIYHVVVISTINILLQFNLFQYDWQFLHQSTDSLHHSIQLQQQPNYSTVPLSHQSTCTSILIQVALYLFIMTCILHIWRYSTDRKYYNVPALRKHSTKRIGGCCRYYIRSSSKGARIGYKRTRISSTILQRLQAKVPYHQSTNHQCYSSQSPAALSKYRCDSDSFPIEIDTHATACISNDQQHFV